MPDHVHFIISITHDTPNTMSENGTSGSPSPTNAIIPKIVSALKRFTNKEIGFDIWQRSYYDHIIRNEKEYLEISRYIAVNPARWAEKYM